MSTYYFVYDWIQCGSLKEITDWLRNSDRKVAVNYKHRWNGTFLHHALYERQSLEMIATLIEHGCNVNATTYVGVTPLMISVMQHNVPICRYLIEQGANINTVCETEGYGELSAMYHSVRNSVGQISQLTTVNRLTVKSSQNRSSSFACELSLNPLFPVVKIKHSSEF